MAYSKEEILKETWEALEDPYCWRIEDIIDVIQCSKPTFYELFPVDSDELNAFKKALAKNRSKKRSDYKRRLEKIGDTGSLVVLYKLVATQDEWLLLSGHKKDVEPKSPTITIVK